MDFWQLVIGSNDVNFHVLSEWVIVFRLIMATILGGLIGLEREYHGQPAGLRTHIILAIGSAFIMGMSINVAFYGQTGDAARLAAQVVSGVGFLGAGAIFKYGGGVRGLTTAASIWTSAAIGLACGAGYFIAATVGTALVLFSLIVLNSFEKSFIHEKTTRTIVIKAIDHFRFVDEVKTTLKDHSISTRSISFIKDVQANHIEVKAIIQSANDQDMDLIIAAIQKINGVEYLSLNQDYI